MFLTVAFGGAWALWVPLALAGDTVVAGQGWPSHLPGLTAPALGAIAALAVTGGWTGLAEFSRRLVTWRVPPLATVILAALTLAATLAILVGAASGVQFAYSGAPLWGLGVVAYVLVVNGFGEEAGWRGYLGDRLLARHSPGITALIVWAVWGIWHLPLFFVVQNLHDLGPAGTLGWALGLLSGSIVLLWLYQFTNRSILYVALWHTAFNFATATTATAGVIAAVVSTLVMVSSIPLVVRPAWWRRPTAIPSTPKATAS